MHFTHLRQVGETPGVALNRGCGPIVRSGEVTTVTTAVGTADRFWENGVNWCFLFVSFFRKRYISKLDTFLHPLNAGRCDIHFNFLGGKLKMMEYLLIFKF